jgi:type VI secretion system protein ImpG
MRTVRLVRVRHGVDPELVEYYQRELFYMRELAAEFAQAHPKIARRLGMQAGEIGDVYVERLIEAFALTAGRSQMRIDRMTEAFTRRLLECVNPNYVTLLPSLAVARFFPDPEATHNPYGQTLPRGTRIMSRKAVEGRTVCEFRSSQPVTIWPLALTHARWTGIPPDLFSLHRYVDDPRQVRGALRLRLRTINGASIGSLQGLDRLPVYLCGEPRMASHLFELIHTSVVGMVMGVPGGFDTEEKLHGMKLAGRPPMGVDYEGLEPEQSLLRPASRALHGHTLVHEYFAQPQRFWFFALTELAAGLQTISGPEVEIVLLLTREVAALDQQVDASHMALFCTPIANLYPVRTGRLHLDADAREHRLVPYVTAPDDHEVHSLELAKGQVDEESEEIAFQPLDVAIPDDEHGDERYFTLRRELDEPAGRARRYGTRQRFIRTHVLLSLLDHDHRPDQTGIRYVTLDAWLTNADLPCLAPCNGVNDLVVRGAKGLTSAGFVRAPTPPRPPLAHGDTAWELVRQLHLELEVFDSNFDERRPGEGLRMMLQPYLGAGDTALARQLDSLIGATAEPVYGMHRQAGELQLARGMKITLTFDESGLDGMSPFTFALALERYVTRHVSTHSFTQTVLCTKQRGAVFTFPTRDGTRGIF